MYPTQPRKAGTPQGSTTTKDSRQPLAEARTAAGAPGGLREQRPRARTAGAPLGSKVAEGTHQQALDKENADPADLLQARAGTTPACASTRPVRPDKNAGLRQAAAGAEVCVDRIVAAIRERSGCDFTSPKMLQHFRAQVAPLVVKDDFDEKSTATVAVQALRRCLRQANTATPRDPEYCDEIQKCLTQVIVCYSLLILYEEVL